MKQHQPLPLHLALPALNSFGKKLAFFLEQPLGTEERYPYFHIMRAYYGEVSGVQFQLQGSPPRCRFMAEVDSAGYATAICLNGKAPRPGSKKFRALQSALRTLLIELEEITP